MEYEQTKRQIHTLCLWIWNVEHFLFSDLLNTTRIIIIVFMLVILSISLYFYAV